jgi:hypothetical protein
MYCNFRENESRFDSFCKGGRVMKKHKRTPRQLVLKHEAIRMLTGHELAHVAGGANQPRPFDQRLTDTCVCGSTL